MSIVRVGQEIRVNSATANDQTGAQIVVLSNGGFVLTWQDASQGVGGTGGDTSDLAVKAQVFAAGGTPVGAEILVNSATLNPQFGQQITALANGGFVVTWADLSMGVGGAGGDASAFAIKAQVFTAGGTPVGSEFLVNTATANFQSAPQITALSNGGFAVTWYDLSHGVGGAGGDASLSALKAQVFAAGGTPVGTEILVNTATANDQYFHQMTALSNGGFVVTWQDYSLGVGGAGGDASNAAIKAQVFAAGGTPVGPEIRVNTAIGGDQFQPQITTLANGGFVVTWQDLSLGAGGAGGDTSGIAVKAQVFAAGGTPVGPEILVNSATDADQIDPQVTALANGGFVVTWTDESAGVGGTGGDTSSTAVKAQIFAAGGTKVGAEILVNSATAGEQSQPQITALANGGFVVTWRDLSQGVGGTSGDASNYAVKAQVFAANGTLVSTEILVNSATAGDQEIPQITALPDGGFVVTWRDNSQGVGGAGGDTSTFAVKAQVFGIINDAPLLNGVPAAAAYAYGPAVILAPGLTISDLDSATLTSATVRVGAGAYTAHGDVLAVTAAGLAGTNIVASYNAATETLTLSGTDTLAHYTQALEHVTFQTTNFGIDRAQSIAWQVNDGEASNNLSAVATTSLSGPKPPANDFNGDGHSDILWQNTDGTPAVWLTDGTALISGSNVGFNPGTNWHEIGSGDFNGDGKSDILWQHADGTIAEWFMNGTSLISGGSVAFNPGPSWHAIGTGDFNADGKADIVWQNNDGAAAVWLMDGLNILSGANVGTNPGPAWHVIGAGDFNGDGKSDILWQNNDGTVAEWLMDGASLISGASVAFNPGAAWHAIGTGDFNADGKADILWQNNDGTPAVWLMDGLNILQGANVGFNPGPAWHALKTGDYNADGNSDILWQNDNGAAAVWLMDGTTLISGADVGVNPGSNWQVIPQDHDLLV